MHLDIGNGFFGYAICCIETSGSLSYHTHAHTHIYLILFVTLGGLCVWCFPLDGGDLSFGATFFVHTHVGASTCLQIVMQLYCAHHHFDDQKSSVFFFFGGLICRSSSSEKLGQGDEPKHIDVQV